jgi:pyridoxal biosynthesis lyase PdxS
MELGCDGVLMNSAIANANDPILMASAMALEHWYNLKPDLFIRKPDMFRSVVFESRE